MADTTTSRDGTVIAYEATGHGPPVVLVAGALGTRRHPMMASLAAALARDFTVYNYDRRGRGDSGDTLPYAVAREIDDVAAIIDEAGGSACLYGISSGGVLALEVAIAPPGAGQCTGDLRAAVHRRRRPSAGPGGLRRPRARGRARGDRRRAVELFMTEALGLPAEMLPAMRATAMWAAMEAVADTLPYDAEIVRDTQTGQPLPAERLGRWRAATMPTLIVSGAASEPFFHAGAQALADALPDACYEALPGQDHDVDADALAPLLAQHFRR